jgi:hypothetical protein
MVTKYMSANLLRVPLREEGLCDPSFIDTWFHPMGALKEGRLRHHKAVA